MQLKQDSDSRELRAVAYTTPRPDVFAMVPDTAMAILDVGCSNGSLGASLRSACPRRTVVGVEIDPDFAHEACGHLDKVVCADLNDLNWSAAILGMRFDCIIFADVLEHLIDPAKHLVEAQRFLLPGGCMIISLPNIRHVSSLYSIFLKGTFPRRDRGIFDKTHLRWFTIGDAKALVADVGMRIERVTYVLRVGDTGGGLINRLANRFLGPFPWFFPVREFLTYQFCLRTTSCR